MQRAAWLAKSTGAELELLICYYNEYLSGDRLFDSPSLEKARNEIIANEEQRLETLAEPIREAGIVVKTTALWDHPLYEGIVRQAIESEADIVFKDTHHHSAVTRGVSSGPARRPCGWSSRKTSQAPRRLLRQLTL